MVGPHRGQDDNRRRGQSAHATISRLAAGSWVGAPFGVWTAVSTTIGGVGMSTRIRWMPAAAAYASATAMDLGTTSLALGLGLREGNPVAAPFINAYGLGPQILVSIFLCGVLGWYASKGGVKLVVILAVIRWIVVFNNLIQLYRANW